MNKALLKLKEINPHYKDVVFQNSWVDLTEKSDPTLWKLLTDIITISPDSDNEVMDFDEEIEGKDHAKEEQMRRKSSGLTPTVTHNVHGPNISSSDVLNLAPGQNQIPVSFTSKPNWEALAFPKDFSTAVNRFGQARDVRITPVRYAHASNLQYLLIMISLRRV